MTCKIGDRFSEQARVLGLPSQIIILKPKIIFKRAQLLKFSLNFVIFFVTTLQQITYINQNNVNHNITFKLSTNSNAQKHFLNFRFEHST